MAQNIYDQADFFIGYSRLGRSVHGLAGAAEWPAIRALLPDLAGKRIVDLGCGFGWFVRWAKEQGAGEVLGLDLSEKMIARARAETTAPGVDYRIADLEQLELPAASFDFAYSSLAFHYIEDFGRLVRTVHRALVPGAGFVFTVEHPIYMAPSRPGWSIGADGQRTWPIDRYAVEGLRTTDWLAKGVVKQHRTLGTTVNTLIGSGFSIRHLQEWAPTPQQVAEVPDLAQERDRPMILIVSAERTSP
ncbi:MAG: SAM-dependent methyltransferase [Alphaproteobacteria bacterium 65-37]|nr:class I SAM-dependent methyltransferase [Alphaproteobacteria bacterium]OJU36333.1 MAG: SAM-dependent methyltransferase [Alphaproteobacteria bacterium 65-37]